MKCLKVIYLIKEKKIEEAISSAKILLIPYVKKKVRRGLFSFSGSSACSR